MSPISKTNTKTILFVLLFLNSFLNAQTTISGVIGSNTTWSPAGSPYIVTANTIVMDNVTLSIQPGVDVQFNSNVQLSLRGKLFAHGTSSSHIRFLAQTAAAWNGIYVDNSSTHTPKVDLSFVDASKSINCLKVATTGGSDTLIKLTHCTFNDHSNVLDQYDGTKTHLVYIDSCTFSNITNYVNAGASNNIITNSTFLGTYRALYNSTSQGTLIDKCKFSGYTSLACAVTGTITNSEFYNNQTGICTMDLTQPTIKYNNIHANNTGIEAWNFGSANPTSQINFNIICSNAIGVRKIYSTDTYVPYNCWCLSDSAQIQNSVFDFFDAPNLGLIFYTPFDVNCTYSGPVGIKSNIPLVNASVNIYPNPFASEFAINTNFNMPTSIDVRLVDPLGKEITKIYSGTMREGYQNINYNSSELAPGIYFISIRSENSVVTKKIIKL